jgi:hypothetical protein
MPVGQEHHERVAVTVPIPSGGFDQPLDLIGRQVFACAQLGIRRAPWGDCAFFSGWRDQLEMRIRHDRGPAHLMTVQLLGIL